MKYIFTLLYHWRNWRSKRLQKISNIKLGSNPALSKSKKVHFPLSPPQQLNSLLSTDNSNTKHSVIGMTIKTNKRCRGSDLKEASFSRTLSSCEKQC